MSMSQGRKSLMDESEAASFDSKHKPKTKTARVSGATAMASMEERTKKIKIGIAGGALLVAAVLLAWNFGVFGGGPKEEATGPVAPASEADATKAGVKPAGSRRVAPQ